MSRNTVTLTASNGAKVRTVRSKLLFVVESHEVTQKWNQARQDYDRFETPVAVASVIKRTDSFEAALTTLRKNRGAEVFRVTVNDGEVLVVKLDQRDLESRVATVKANKAFAASVGNNGEARRLFY